MPAEWSTPRAVSLAEQGVRGQIAGGRTVESAIFESIFADPAQLVPFILIGFAAQLVDGALGMAFGVISNTLLISMGVPPAGASAIVHIIKNFTGAVSAVSHVMHKNVDWRLFWRLLIPGMIGGIIGAYLLSSIDAAVTKPLVLIYLAAIGVYLLIRALRSPPVERRPRIVEPLGLAGGFLDSVGGGGWGPVVTSNLLVQGVKPRMVVGTVNTSELFLALTISGAFFFSLGLTVFGKEAVGLLIGGVAAAPLGGFVARRINGRLILIMVGIVLAITSLMGLAAALL